MNRGLQIPAISRRIFLHMQPLSTAAVLTAWASNSVNANLLPLLTCLKEKYTCMGGWKQCPVLLWKSKQNPDLLHGAKAVPLCSRSKSCLILGRDLLFLLMCLSRCASHKGCFYTGSVCDALRCDLGASPADAGRAAGRLQMCHG